MHVWLIVGKNKPERERELERLVGRLAVRRINYRVESIAEVRELRKYLKLKVVEPVVYVFEDFDKVSTEAQNAMLKALEEPQHNVNFILTASTEDEILPTIRSRSLVIQSGHSAKCSDESVDKAFAFINQGGGERMKRVAEIKDRSDAVAFLRELLIVGRDLMKKGELDSRFLESAQLALDNIGKNGNVALQLTNFVAMISLEK